MINLTPYAIQNPIEVSEEEYDQLVQKMLAKLHYLRLGFGAGKIQEADFLDREQKLVLNWWNRGS